MPKSCGGEQTLSNFMSQYLENGTYEIHPKLLLTNRKLHMRFRLALRSMTVDEFELLSTKFSRNFAWFRRFETQQRLNKLW